MSGLLGGLSFARGVRNVKSMQDRNVVSRFFLTLFALKVNRGSLDGFFFPSGGHGGQQGSSVAGRAASPWRVFRSFVELVARRDRLGTEMRG